MIGAGGLGSSGQLQCQMEEEEGMRKRGRGLWRSKNYEGGWGDRVREWGAGPGLRGRGRGVLTAAVSGPSFGHVISSVLLHVILDVLFVGVLRGLVPWLQQPAHVVVLLHELHLPLPHALHLHCVQVGEVVVLVP